MANLTVFEAYFEGNDFSEFDGTGGAPAVVGAPVHHGSYAMECDAGNEYAWDSVLNEAYSEVWCRFYLYVTARTGAVNLRGLKNASYTALFYPYISSGGMLGVGYRDSGGLHTDTSATQSIGTGQWYCIEYQAVFADGTDGEYHIYVDGVEVADLAHTGIDTDNDGNPKFFELGTEWVQTSVQVGFDCVVIDSSRVTCESAGNQCLFTLINEMNY